MKISVRCEDLIFLFTSFLDVLKKDCSGLQKLKVKQRQTPSNYFLSYNRFSFRMSGLDEPYCPFNKCNKHCCQQVYDLFFWK